ncbi:MAG: TIGR00266 family protein, partial [Spirochaetales bacterium]|nr:TIGR00266 family protein [Spirochaetales bacterium]
MQTTIDNAPVFTTLTVALSQGEQFRAEAGAMVSMSSTIELEAKTQGKGLGGILRAAVGGEGIFASQFTASGGPGEVVLAPAVPGDVVEFSLQNQTIYAQSGAYLAGASDLELGTKGSLKAMVSGEGLFLQTVSGTGPLFLSCYGAIFTRDLEAGETYV